MKNYFVIGNPIEHSFSPRLHNYWNKIHNIKAEYFKRKLSNLEIEGFINDFRQKKNVGC